ncbi:hypothetical protein N7457_007780 [Penicillium paradoxum]|uniref:uncharacterized protein n=1 Tax=Penicillium paradoxum TaxID=176176 RepID=UPI0025482B63|nr:uncharacterized protein N7457_007780 [Penicillium paradoxum]KAJ5772884.1 hypothetical protein N7457_007780 [Penicillium paradoxum]
MEDENFQYSERPSKKRVRQACEPCRRKKAKCPGEQPICSLCARLRQQCLYADERRRPLPESSPKPNDSDPQTSQVLADRLRNLESQIGKVLDVLGSKGEPQMSTETLVPSVTLSVPTSSVDLPPWEEIIPIAELYLLYCDSQPLPLFHRDSFLSSLQTRETELLFAILALGFRFSYAHQTRSDFTVLVNGYAEVARALVMKRVSEGPVELSTLQCLCILSLVDFTNGNTHRASIHSSLAMHLAQCANLGQEPRSLTSSMAREERRRCFWSICLLKRLHGSDFSILDTPEAGGPPYPLSPTRPAQSLSPGPSVVEIRRNDTEDEGIIAYVVMLSEVFARTSRYVRLHGRPSNLPPWSPHSEYSKILALQMEMETRMPYLHRFKPANLSERSLEELQAHREYWGPWFLNQFLYHTNLCLLNHPLLLSLTLRNFRSTIPEIFLQHSSDLISSHTTWIIHFINYLEEKSLLVSDPFLGYSAAVVATIELQLSFTDNVAIREQKRERFTKCVKFVQTMGERWPHMARLAHRLQRLEDAVSSTYQSDPGAQNQSLLIDLSRFWEILEYSSNSDTQSARRLFGESLYAGASSAGAEVSQTSLLPAPFRLNAQEEASPNIQSQSYSTNAAFPGQVYPANSLISPQQLTLSNDEFSILAANFFSQGQEFLRSGDNWESVGNF